MNATVKTRIGRTVYDACPPGFQKALNISRSMKEINTEELLHIITDKSVFLVRDKIFDSDIEVEEYDDDCKPIPMRLSMYLPARVSDGITTEAHTVVCVSGEDFPRCKWYLDKDKIRAVKDGKCLWEARVLLVPSTEDEIYGKLEKVMNDPLPDEISRDPRFSS